MSLPQSRKQQAGFSLLELLVVLGLMAAAAALALSSVGNRDNQNRFDETRNKIGAMRKAILGESAVINGQLSVNGFVVDMGRLPESLEELLQEPDDCDLNTTGVQECGRNFDADKELWYGWNGPYITAVGTDYRDGWGNPADDQATKITTSTLDDLPENHGWHWDGTVNNTLIVTSNGLDRAFSIDASGNDTLIPSAPEERAYGDSGLQVLEISPNQHSVQLPFSPLYLTVAKVPYCGQCRDLDNTTDADCVTAGNDWNDDLKYCVENTATTPKACEDELGVIPEETRWVALYGTCSNVQFTNKDDCEAVSETWQPLDNNTASNQCSDYQAKTGSPAYNFIDPSEDDFCIRPLQVVNGVLQANIYRSSDAAKKTVSTTIADRSDGIGPTFVYNPNMETDESTPVAGLTLPQGQFRLGLYIYDSAAVTSNCTEDPYPSASAQALSPVITLSSQYPPNVGTSTNPIKINWRSQ